MNVDVTAEPSEVVQSEAPEDLTHPISVSVVGPVQTREVPAIAHPGYSTLPAVTTSLGVRALSMEPRRKSATLISNDQDMYISTSQSGAMAGSAGGMRWPALVPYVVTHAHEVWVCAVTGTTDVGVETINWSD